MTCCCEQKNAKQPHYAGNFRSPSIPVMEDNIIVRAKEPVLLAPVVVLNMGSTY